MKIVDVCEFYSPTGGGVRRYINQKLALASKFGHELTIIAPGAYTRTEQAHGGTIAWIKSPHLPFDRNYRMFWNHQQVWRTLDRLAPDLVEGSSPWRGGWLAARWPGKAVKVFFMHADPVAVYPQTFLGGDALTAAYASSDIFFFPSDSESFGNVTLEAMASGLPCVCAAATGSRSLVVAGQTGFLSPADDAASFARHITALAQDNALRERMGLSARARALTFSWDETLARMLGYYRALLSGTASP